MLTQSRAATDPRLRVLPLARNFGKEAALTAGLEQSIGDAVIAAPVSDGERIYVLDTTGDIAAYQIEALKP